jgi:hypothetical protein
VEFNRDVLPECSHELRKIGGRADAEVSDHRRVLRTSLAPAELGIKPAQTSTLEGPMRGR